MTRAVGAVIAAGFVLLLAAPVAAQAPGIELKVNPRIGLYAPLTDLAEAETAAGTIAQEMSGSLALGLGVEVDMVLLPINIRANLDYATGSEVTVTEDGVEQGEPVETTLLAVVGDLVFRPLPKIILVQPYLFAGGGLKQYDVGEETTTSSFRSEGDFTLHLGGGLDFGLGPLALNAEVGDYISWADFQVAAEGDEESQIQHDLFVTVGFAIGLL